MVVSQFGFHLQRGERFLMAVQDQQGVSIDAERSGFKIVNPLFCSQGACFFRQSQRLGALGFL